jgi:hypothetical protein
MAARSCSKKQDLLIAKHIRIVVEHKSPTGETVVGNNPFRSDMSLQCSASSLMRHENWDRAAEQSFTRYAAKNELTPS